MTMPHLQNCPHNDSGWCLACVGELWRSHQRIANESIDHSAEAFLARSALASSTKRQIMVSLLNVKRDKRYRAGVIQLAVLLGIITDMEWRVLAAVIRSGERVIKEATA